MAALQETTPEDALLLLDEKSAKKKKYGEIFVKTLYKEIRQNYDTNFDFTKKVIKTAKLTSKPLFRLRRLDST